MLFEDDVVVVVVEQDGDGAELRGGAARFGDLVRLQDVNHLLDEGVVGGVHAGAQRIKALSITVVRRVSSRSQNPVLPAQIAEADVEFVLFTGLTSVFRITFFEVGDWEVVFGFLPAGMRFNGSRRPTRDLVLPEEGDHERLLGARASPTHQPNPTPSQGAVFFCLYVETYAHVAARVDEPVVGG